MLQASKHGVIRENKIPCVIPRAQIQNTNISYHFLHGDSWRSDNGRYECFGQGGLMRLASTSIMHSGSNVQPAQQLKFGKLA